MDPRIPDDQEAFAFELTEMPEGATVDWLVNGVRVATTRTGELLWPLERGDHAVRARLWLDESAQPVETPGVSFIVK